MSARFVIEPAWITTRTVPTWSARRKARAIPRRVVARVGASDV
jgi:hypothetical protein